MGFQVTRAERDTMDLSTIQSGLVMKFSAVSAFVLVIYEDLLISNQKTPHFNLSFRLANLILYVNHYLPVATVNVGMQLYVFNTSLKFCRPGFITQTVLNFLQYSMAIAVLFLRTYVMWSKRRSILLLLSIAYIGFLVGGSYLTYSYIHGSDVTSAFEAMRTLLGSEGSQLELNDQTPSSLYGCLVSVEKKAQLIFFALLITCETLSFVLLLLWRLSYKHDKSFLLHMMYLDGIHYFVCILFATIANFIIISSKNKQTSNAFFAIQAVIHNVLCTRMLLHIRHAIQGIPEDSCNSTIKYSSRSAPERTIGI